MTSLSGKVALVTGAASGMGAASAARLEASGAKVMRTDISIEGTDTFRLDVTDEASWVGAIDRLVTHHGRLDILVNAAGISLSQDSFDTCTEEIWRKTMAVNLDGVFLGCKHAIPLMRQNGGGSIINFGSINSIVADGNAISYVASKGAVRLLTKSVAMHCAESRSGVRCNLICPGYVETPMLSNWFASQGPDTRHQLERSTPMARLARPEEISNLVAWLAGDESINATGGEFVVDGGFIAR